MTSIIRNDGMVTPNVEIIEPASPFFLYPTYVAMLIATTPGRLWHTATMSMNSSFVNHFFSSISVFCRSGSIAIPPPMVNAPNLKNTISSSSNTFIT